MRNEDLPTDADLVQMIDAVDLATALVRENILLITGAACRVGRLVPKEWLDISDRANEEVPV